MNRFGNERHGHGGQAGEKHTDVLDIAYGWVLFKRCLHGSSKTFTVTAVDDTTVDFLETVIFTVASGTGYTAATGAAAAATLTITDNDATASIYIGSAGTQTGTITEASGSTQMTTVTVALSAAAPTGGLTVEMTTSGTATDLRTTNNRDFTRATGVSVRLVGSTVVYSAVVAEGMTTADIVLTAADDSVIDAAETITFTIRDSVAYTTAASTANAATITITDNDPVATIAAATANIAENGGTSILTVTLNAAPTTATTVTLTRSGTATIGTGNDYTQSGLTAGTAPSYTLTVLANMTTANFTLTAVDDSTIDVGETAIFTIASGTGYSVGSTAAATVTITDDDTPTATIGADRTTITEGTASTRTATVTVTLSAMAAADTTVTVNRTYVGGTTDADITETGRVSNAVTVSMGATTATFTVDAVDDSLYDGDPESVTYTLADGTDYDLAGSETSVSIAITDDESLPVVSVHIDSPGIQTGALTEGSSGRVTLQIAVSNDHDVSGGVVFTYTQSGQGAVTGLPSTAGGGTLRNVLATGVQYVIRPADDADANNETYTFTLSSCENCTIAASPANSVTITVTDDD